MQGQIEETISHQYNSGNHNLFCFSGGLIINLICLNEISFKSDLQHILEYILSHDFINYIIRSICGGFVALFFKLFYDGIKVLISWKKSTKKEGGPNELN